ncbi:uncharacterized protein LOC129579634 [Sitodiplosis mosellana]|uniref:uncharacterized protein LOC129579634 n=1 Tax=Sitodiplosis mosellana TaxID=263140 RepID=UPI002443D0AB|nr:uncharacterized protein LOC129579634 [Sitodiplosis mosellana]
MSKAWIERNLPQPPMRSTMQKLKSDIDFDALLNNFGHCESIHDLRPKLEQAAAMASRLIARRAHSFRVQPSFMYFRKMNIALCRLKELNIYQNIKDYQNAIGVAKMARKLDDKYYLPDRENFFYFLTKLQSFAKLLLRTVMCARESHRLFLELLHRAAFIETISLFSAVLAEVWTICIDMCRCVVQFYNGFYPFYAKNYDKSKSLPKRLNKWLGEEYIEYIDISVDQSQLDLNEEFFLFDGSDTVKNEGKVIDQKFEPKLLVNQPVQKNVKGDESVGKKTKMPKTLDLLGKQQNFASTSKPVQVKGKPMISMKPLPLYNKNFDLGEKISRTPTMSRKEVAKVIKHIDVDQLKTIKEIREFLTVEDELRQNDQEQNTKGVTNEEWEKFKTSTTSLLILSHHGLVLKKFRNQWKNLKMRRRYCSEGTRKYICPRCNIAYCSVACYQSPSHLKCSEEFYKDCVVEEMTLQSKMKNTSGPSDDVKKMYDILKRVESGDQPIDSDFELSDEELDSDDDEDEPDDDNDLSKRLEGIDLNDADAIWSKLTESERQEFNKIIQSEDVTSILPKYSAWWEIKTKRKLVSEMNGDETDDPAEPIVEHPKIIESIVDFARISTKTPASCVVNNLINVLTGYASMVRFFYGEYEASKYEAVKYLISVCANLRMNANFDDADVAIESIRQDANNEGYAVDEQDMRQMKKDIDNLMAGPIQDKPTNTFILAALSDLHRLLSAVKTEIKNSHSKPSVSVNAASSGGDEGASSTNEPTNDSEKFTKRFNDQKANACSDLEKGKLTAMIKKIEYYLAYAKKYH